jgi:hypothetical protein
MARSLRRRSHCPFPQQCRGGGAAAAAAEEKGAQKRVLSRPSIAVCVVLAVLLFATYWIDEIKGKSLKKNISTTNGLANESSSKNSTAKMTTSMISLQAIASSRQNDNESHNKQLPVGEIILLALNESSSSATTTVTTTTRRGTGTAATKTTTATITLSTKTMQDLFNQRRHSTKHESTTPTPPPGRL